MNYNKFKIKIEVKYIYIFLFLILVLGFIIFKFIYYDNDIIFGIIDVMAYLTGSVAILTLLYHAFGLESSHQFHRDNLAHQKHQYSYEIISKINEPEFAETLQLFHEIKSQKDYFFSENIDNFKAFLKKNGSKRAKVIMLLNYFEHIAILVENNHVEEEIIKDGFKTLFVNSYSVMKPYIDYRQETHRKSWYLYECLAEKWSKEK
jgi:hypothetical protein